MFSLEFTTQLSKTMRDSKLVCCCVDVFLSLTKIAYLKRFFK